MKFQQTASFEKHLKESHPAKVYMVLIPCEYEREKVISRLKPTLSFEEWGDPILEALNTPSLFGSETRVLLKGAEKLKKGEIEQLASYVAAPLIPLIIGASSSKGLTEIYQKGKKEIVCLDLTEERPWERHKRLKMWVASSVQIEPDAIELLFDRIGPDMPTLDQELKKLGCYVADRRGITAADVSLLVVPREQGNLWKHAEALVRGEKPAPFPMSDVGDLLALLGALNFQLQEGLKSGGPSEKYIRALKATFETEWKAKSTPLSPSLLYDHLTAYL